MMTTTDRHAPLSFENRLQPEHAGSHEKRSDSRCPSLSLPFARKTDRFLGLISAHFEEEEEVLLPILDKTTTREDLEKELEMGGHEKHD